MDAGLRVRRSPAVNVKTLQTGWGGRWVAAEGSANLRIHALKELVRMVMVAPFRDAQMRLQLPASSPERKPKTEVDIKHIY